MNNIGKPERETQDRVIALFRDQLGYRYLGDHSTRVGNSNIEDEWLASYLMKAGYTMEQISRAIYLLRIEADSPNRSLHDNNKAVYSMLRYGVPVKVEAGKVTETVKLIDWEDADANDFVIVEEVTLHGTLERRPDLVLYVNGIAIGVIELKNSHVSMDDGIRQLLSNQQKEFNEWFFGSSLGTHDGTVAYFEFEIVEIPHSTGFVGDSRNEVVETFNEGPEVRPCLTKPQTLALCSRKPRANRWNGAKPLASAMPHQLVPMHVAPNLDDGNQRAPETVP